VLVEHAKEAIVGGGLARVIPFLSMTNDLMCVVELKGEKRINNLGALSQLAVIRQPRKSPNLEGRSGLGIAEIRDVLINEK
jgi:hypothetical protein